MNPRPDVSPEVRRRVEVQGYVGLDDETIRKLDSWIRFVPFVTGLVSAFSTLMVSSAILMVLAVVTAVSAVLPRHPVDMIYNSFIRHLEQTPALPVTPHRRRIVFIVWAALLGAASLCIHTGYTRTGIGVGWIASALISVSASQQICLISEALVRVFPARSGQ